MIFKAAAKTSGQVVSLPDGVDIVWVGGNEQPGYWLQQLEESIEAVVQASGEVGLDIEWRPTAQVPYCALLQLAFRERVYLVDLLVQKGVHKEWFWTRLNRALGALLGSRTASKLGFGFTQDLAKLRESHGDAMPAVKETVHSLVELNLIGRLDTACSRLRPSASGKAGLAWLAQAALGLDLDKTMQVSDWARRPLTEEQIRYAAVDAWVLLSISRALQYQSQPSLSVDEQGQVQPVGVEAVRRIVEPAGIQVEDGEERLDEEIGKCVALMVREFDPVIVVTRRGHTADRGQVAAHFRVAKRQVRMASPRECTEVFGHIPGHIPPVAMRFGDRVHILFSSCLADIDDGRLLMCSGGEPGKIFRATVRQLFELSSGRWHQTAAQPNWAAEVDIEKSGFVCDSMMRRTARWLRLLGVDTMLDSSEDMHWVLRTAQDTGRVILTKNERLVPTAHRLGLPCLLLQPDTAYEQLLEIVKVFGITISYEKLISRCVKCNNPVMDKMDREAVSDILPQRHALVHNEFWRCTNCKQIYWKGSHYKNQMMTFEDLKHAVEDQSIRTA